MITYTSAVVMNTDLHIRNGSAHVLSQLPWPVASQVVNEPSLGRPLLKALEFDCRKVMKAAAGRIEGSVDVLNIAGSKSDFCVGRVGRVVEGRRVCSG